MQGERLGPYRIDRELGAGGMGKVYAATVAERAPGLTVGERVALKVVHPHLLERPGFFMRFMREAQIGASIQHDNVVRTHHCDQVIEAGRPLAYLVMEFVEGQTLRDLLAELDKVPEELCRHIGREIARGIGAIHGAGVVHRDLKPENVLITPDHVVKVMDLGVAQLTEESIRLSHSGAFVGSAEYAAPEQFGGTVDHRCDLHALGLLLYELSTGQQPYRADDFRGVMKKVCEESPRRAGDINPQLSPFFEEAVHTLLAKRADDRFDDADTLLSVLEEGEDSAWWHERAKALQVETKRPLRRIRIPRETAVYGRDKELDRLRVLYGKAKSGDGQVVVIEGEAGIGKSRLVDELIARIQADGEDINFLFGSYPPGGAATASGAFSAAYREHFGATGSAEHLEHLQLLAPAFDALLQGGTTPTGVEQLTKDSLQTCFVTVTRSLAAERPTVVLIDDLHFAPDEGRALFSALATAVPGARVLLVGTTRPGVSEEWMAGVSRLDQTSQIEVARLGPKDLIDLLKDCFKSEELAMGLSAQIAVKSDGNPFFAFEIVRGLREGQFITQRDDGTWASTRIIDEIQIPSSVLDLVNARVAGLSEDERALLDVAACWGYEFDPGLVGEVLGLARIPALRSFGQIERLHRLVRSSGRSYVFDHHQVQEALYGSLNEQLREEYHAALAVALESRTKAADGDPGSLDGALCVDLCEHYLKGARGEAALRYLPAAQKHLQNGYLNAQVIALTERALAVPDLLTGAGRAMALLRLVGALNRLGRRAREEECLREAEQLAEAADDDELRGHVATGLGGLYWRTGRTEESALAHRRVLDLARARGDRRLEGVAIGNLGLVHFSEGKLDVAWEEISQARAITAETGNRVGEAGTALSLGSILIQQRREVDAQPYIERSLALSREIGYRQGEASAIGDLGWIASRLGRFAEGQSYLERQLSLCREIGNRRGEATALGNWGLALWRERRRDELPRIWNDALAIYCEIGDREGEGRVSGYLAMLAWSQGRLAEAERLNERYLALAQEIGDRRGEANAALHLGLTLLSEGRLAESRQLLGRSLELSRELGRRENEAPSLHSLARALSEQGEWELAERHLSTCLDVATDVGQGRDIVLARLALGSVRAERARALGVGAESARDTLVAARDAAREQDDAESETLARCELALLPGGDADDAVAAYTEHEGGLDDAARREARLMLFKATRDRAHLTEAKRLLDEALAKAPERYRESMCSNVRVNREILAAWRAEFGDDDEPRGTESVTKAGLS